MCKYIIRKHFPFSLFLSRDCAMAFSPEKVDRGPTCVYNSSRKNIFSDFFDCIILTTTIPIALSMHPLSISIYRCLVFSLISDLKSKNEHILIYVLWIFLSSIYCCICFPALQIRVCKNRVVLKRTKRSYTIP